MEVKDIIALANAGFTAQQIATLAGQAEKQTEPKQEDAQVKTETTDDHKQLAGQQQVKLPYAPQGPDPMAAMFAKMEELQKTVQSAALKRTEQPAEESVDDILASIINPPQKA